VGSAAGSSRSAGVIGRESALGTRRDGIPPSLFVPVWWPHIYLQGSHMPSIAGTNGQPRLRLTPNQQEFLRLLVEQGETPTNAYRLAYNDKAQAKVISSKATRLRRHPVIAAALAEAHRAQAHAVDVAVERYSISADRVADAMARLAFTELRQIVDVHSVVVGGQHRRVVDVKDFSDIDGDAHQAIAEVRKTAGGELTVKLFNKREALMDLARLKGWIADKPVDQRSLVMLKIER
jgi:terminase small subunit-like protein